MQVFLRNTKLINGSKVLEYIARWQVTANGVSTVRLARCVLQHGVHVADGPVIWSLFVLAPVGFLDASVAGLIKLRVLPHVPMGGDAAPKATPCGREAMCLVECTTMPFRDN